jgi:hypothetical protein
LAKLINALSLGKWGWDGSLEGCKENRTTLTKVPKLHLATFAIAAPRLFDPCNPKPLSNGGGDKNQ